MALKLIKEYKFKLKTCNQSIEVTKRTNKEKNKQDLLPLSKEVSISKIDKMVLIKEVR